MATLNNTSKFDGSKGVRGYAWSILGCVFTTFAASFLSRYFDLANIVMLFLLTVVLVGVRLGRGPAVMASFLSVALFDYYFVPPSYSFAVSDVQYLLTFLIMLTVALITGQLTAGLKQQAEEALHRERQTSAFYQMASRLAGALTPGQVAEITHTFLRDNLRIDSALLVTSHRGLGVAGEQPAAWLDLDSARSAHEKAAQTEAARAGMYSRYLPLRGPMRVRGVLAVRAQDEVVLDQGHQLLEMTASLAAIAVERLHYVDVAQRAEVDMASERLRSSILSALSHDLRTPLTALVGLADTLTVARPALPKPQQETAVAMRDQALRLSGMVTNLLEMARLHAGKIILRKEWQPLEEVIGASIQLLGATLAEHPIVVSLPKDLPLLEFDSVLIERVFCNLLENAAKYSGAGLSIEITARKQGQDVEVSVRDHGNGIPSERQADIFAMFVRGDHESTVIGAGLGLAISKAIVEAHGGTISAANHPKGGACFSFTLPAGTPPSIRPDEGDAS